eukprot:SAG25_NODE_1246_length_3507_cov_5.960387_1_plen_174_part_00
MCARLPAQVRRAGAPPLARCTRFEVDTNKSRAKLWSDVFGKAGSRRFGKRYAAKLGSAEEGIWVNPAIVNRESILFSECTLLVRKRTLVICEPDDATDKSAQGLEKSSLDYVQKDEMFHQDVGVPDSGVHGKPSLSSFFPALDRSVRRSYEIAHVGLLRLLPVRAANPTGYTG